MLDLTCLINNKKAKTNVQITEVSKENECSEQLQLEWLQEVTSERDDFIVVHSRKRKKESRRNLKISPNNRRGRKV